MKFGRLEDISHIDFKLPPEDRHNASVLAPDDGITKTASTSLYIGCPVWADKGYVGKVFPKGTKAKDYLYHYARQFNCIELNATHYTIPSTDIVQRWAEQTPEHFRFCPKFSNSISHRNDYGHGYGALDRFIEAMYAFGPRLGTSFLQFPPYFGADRMESLFTFLGGLPRDMDIAVELRHPSWFSDETLKEEFFERLASLGISSVITDTPGRRDVLHQRLTTRTAFVRFLAHNLHPSDYTRINDWCVQLYTWLASGLDTAYFFMHQPEKHLCADLSTYMIGKMNSDYGQRLRPPLDYNSQRSLFDQ